MTQKEFTDFVIAKILDSFPQFRDCCTFKPNDIVDIDYASQKGKLTLWVTTQDKEITIGFTGDKDCDWHTHMSLFGANTPEEELIAAIEIVKNILGDKTLIVHSSDKGFYRLDTTGNYEARQRDITTYKWSDL